MRGWPRVIGRKRQNMKQIPHTDNEHAESSIPAMTRSQRSAFPEFSFYRGKNTFSITVASCKKLDLQFPNLANERCWWHTASLQPGMNMDELEIPTQMSTHTQHHMYINMSIIWSQCMYSNSESLVATKDQLQFEQSAIVNNVISNSAHK